MTIITVPEVHAGTVAAFRGWAQQFGRYDDDRTVDALLGCAASIAVDLDVEGVGAVELVPGNATRYALVVQRLHPDAAGSLGGQHLVSLPLQRRCYAITLNGLLTPDYVAESFRLDREDDALLYAGLLSLLGDVLP